MKMNTFSQNNLSVTMFHRLIAKYDYAEACLKLAGPVMIPSTLLGILGNNEWDTRHRPYFRDTIFHSCMGGMFGAMVGGVLVITHPISIPILGGIGPIHLYKKYRYEKHQNE